VWEGFDNSICNMGCNMGCNSLKLFIRIEKKMYLIDYPFVNNFMHDILSPGNLYQYPVNYQIITRLMKEEKYLYELSIYNQKPYEVSLEEKK
jgi:hypothetical protein